MQSRQVNVASIEGPLSFAEALAACGEPGSVAVADTSGQMTLGSAGKSMTAVLIGPEGGFSGAELDLADRCGASRTLLPGGVLRAETAAVVAGCLLSAGAIGYAQSSPL